MQSIRWLAAVTGTLALVSACGGDNGGGGIEPNTPPVANFTAPNCTANVACNFTDASTDADGTITGWRWDFKDGTPISNDQSPVHSFAAAGTYQVELTVTDNAGESHTTTKAVTVAPPAPPANQPPTASFSVPSCGAGLDCSFQSISTDADGQITATHWEFGDPTSPNNTADGVSVTHRYAAAGAYQVTLTVTDDDGATGTTTQTVTVLPAPAEDCATSGTAVTCTLDIPQQSTVKLTLTSRECQLSGNRVSVLEPVLQTAFGNICTRPFPAEYTVTDGSAAATPAVFAAGSQVNIRFHQGTAQPTHPVPGSPVARVEGTAPNWTITVDDGGNPAGQNEPDFNDVVLSVQLTPAP